MNSVYSIWKPVGISSYDVIRRIKKISKNKYKIGHAGTLDPFAEGILLICTGKMVKSIDRFVDLPKTYYAEIILHKETDTLDCTGNVIKSSNKIKIVSKKNIKKILNIFTNNYRQSPPSFSAKKIKGKKLYEFARKDIFIRLKAVNVQIYNIQLLHYDKNNITILVSCSPGTYIRSLAKDISAELGTFGYLNQLKRIKIGPYNNSNSISMDNFKYVFSS